MSRLVLILPDPPARSERVAAGIQVICNALAGNREAIRQASREGNHPYLVILQREQIELENSVLALRAVYPLG